MGKVKFLLHTIIKKVLLYVNLSKILFWQLWKKDLLTGKSVVSIAPQSLFNWSGQTGFSITMLLVNSESSLIMSCLHLLDPKTHFQEFTAAFQDGHHGLQHPSCTPPLTDPWLLITHTWTKSLHSRTATVFKDFSYLNSLWNICSVPWVWLY